MHPAARRTPISRGTAALAALLCLASIVSAEDTLSALMRLRLALRTPVTDGSPNSKDVQLRRNAVQEAVAALSRLPDLREALLLQEWRDEDAEEQVAAVDKAARLETSRRFEQALHTALQQGDPASRVAAASMIAEMPAPVRSNGIHGWTFRSCSADLADLVRGNDSSAQAAAALALGAINADPAVAVPALAELMKSEDAGSRRAAAKGLAGLIRLAQTSRRPNASPDGPAHTQVFQVGRAILPVVGGGLADPDAEVRRLCIEAIQKTAAALVWIVGDPPAGYNSAELQAYRSDVAKQYAQLWPLACDLKDQTAGLTNALSDPVPEIRLQAHHALEDMGRAWLRLEAGSARSPSASRPPDGQTTSNPKEAEAEPATESQESKQPLLDRLHAALPAISTGVADPNVGARRAAVDALETLGTEAASAVPALVRAFADPDLFVRWAAVRALGKMGPDELTKIVPGLVQSLGDVDLDVRLAAAHTLGQFGPAAHDAIPALAKAAGTGDTDMRLAALQALEGIGSDAQSSLATVAASLQDPDPRIRQETARLMGKLGPAAMEQKDALRTALADQNADVRKAAGDALLRILYPSANVPPIIVGQEGPPLEILGENATAEKAPSAASVDGPDLLSAAAGGKTPSIVPDPVAPAAFLPGAADSTAFTGPAPVIGGDFGPSLPILTQLPDVTVQKSAVATAILPAKVSAGPNLPECTGPLIVANPEVPAEQWHSMAGSKDSNAIVPASAWQEAAPLGGPALGSQTRLTQARLLRPVSCGAQPPAPAAISPAIAQQAAVAVPVVISPPAAVLMPPLPVYTPPPYRALGPPPPGTVIARTEQ